MPDIIIQIFFFVTFLLWGTRPGKTVESHAVANCKKVLPIPPRPVNLFIILPNELLVEIGTLLSSVDRACLSYTHRRAYSCIGRALRLAPLKAKREFLSRLDRDGFLPFDILCHECNMFHPPRSTREWNHVEGRRACIGNGHSEAIEQGYLDSPFLPYHVHFDMVAAICRSARIEMGSYVVNCLADRQVYKTEGAKISSRISARIFDGQLILKTENVLLLQPGPDLSRNVTKLNELLSENWKLTEVCGHVYWDRIWPFILNPEEETPDVAMYNRVLSKDTTTLPVLDGWDLSNCIWSHGITCWTICDATPWIEWHSDELWACGKCSTDFKISVVRRPPDHPRANAIVFTSWKNLGRGVGLSDANWRGHMDTFDDVEDDSRATRPNNVAEMFEGIAGLGTRFTYMPKLDEVLEELGEVSDD